MYQLIDEPRTEKINKHTAEKLLALPRIEAQRNLRPRLIDIYANKMREGLFRTGLIAIAKLNYNGMDEVVVNGQHQLNAVIQSNTQIRATVERYTCDTPEDLSMLYGQFDTEGGRSLKDLVRMEVSARKLKWPINIASLVVTSGAVISKMDKSPKYEKIELIKDFLKEGSFINRILITDVDKMVVNKTQHVAHLHRSPVVYAMLLTWKVSQKDADSFWTQVRDGEGLKRNMPAYLLREFLKTHTFGRGRGASRNGKQECSFHEMASRCVAAWNAFRNNIPTRLTYHATKPIPKPV